MARQSKRKNIMCDFCMHKIDIVIKHTPCYILLTPCYMLGSRGFPYSINRGVVKLVLFGIHSIGLCCYGGTL